jgi:hypothetical protein
VLSGENFLQFSSGGKMTYRGSVAVLQSGRAFPMDLTLPKCTVYEHGLNTQRFPGPELILLLPLPSDTLAIHMTMWIANKTSVSCCDVICHSKRYAARCAQFYNKDPLLDAVPPWTKCKIAHSWKWARANAMSDLLCLNSVGSKLSGSYRYRY